MSNIQVYIAGAGPGTSDLLTLKVLRLLENWAEVVVYDRLVDVSIIDLIPDGVERVYAGKSCKQHVMTQEEINAELVMQAKKGRNVLRLKGGDPFIFGRGGEEMHALLEQDITCEVIPGVSAASGISASLGLPLTHRGVATSVQYITGHRQKGEEVELDWAGMSHRDVTLVLYMALTRIDEITAMLIDAGRDANTPAAAIQNGTLEGERFVFSPLKTLPNAIQKAELRSPSLIVIGDVVTLSPYYK